MSEAITFWMGKQVAEFLFAVGLLALIFGVYMTSAAAKAAAEALDSWMARRKLR